MSNRFVIVARRVEITSVTGALMNGTWWVWWGDAAGRVSRRDVTALLRARGTLLVPTEEDVIVRMQRTRT